ncbi:MAG: thiol-activated cytolysin family protein [Prevotellaceae bacterium]|nr:thiol-activated cytolysin family protein [Prevotellaceae bacterium]
MKKKLLLMFLVGCLAASCEKDIAVDPNGLTPEQQKIQALLESGGYLQITEDEKTNVSSVDTVEKIHENDYDDPETDDLTEHAAGYAVKTRKTYDIAKNPEEFVTYNPWTDLYPGALVQGGTLRDGVPSTIPIISKRKPGRIYISAVTGNPDMDEWYKEVEIRGSSVTQAMNELLTQHLNSNFGPQTWAEIKRVQSVTELANKLDLNVKMWGAKLNSSFGSSFSETKSYVAVSFRQIYFTVAYENPEGFTGVFTDDITVQDLKNYTGNGNPICYVSSVSYGRAYVLLYESTASERDLETTLQLAYNTGNVDFSDKQKNIFNNSTCTVVQLGGDPQTGLEAIFGDIEKVREFISNGSIVSDVNVGVPISYKINHLADNTTARLTNTLSYTFTSQEFYPDEPLNNIVIDIFNIRASSGSEGTISNYSNFTISSLSIYYNNGSERKVIAAPVTVPLKGGVNYPVFYYRLFENVNKDSRIRIECKIKAHHQTYGNGKWGQGGTHEYNPEYTLVQDFEYKTNDNKWLPVINTDAAARHKPFESLNCTLSGANMNTDVSLYYRFSCDGRIYDYATDGQ